MKTSNKNLAQRVLGTTKLALLLFLLPLNTWAYDPADTPPKPAHETPEEIEGVGVFERLGEEVDLNNKFYDETGAVVSLGRYFGSEKPVILSFVYYDCPSLCNYHLNGVNDVLKKVNLKPGKDFELVAVSMNHREDAVLASDKKDAYVHDYGDPIAAAGYHFLTGDEPNIKRLAAETGFKFKWNPNNKQYSHTSAAIILTPDGKISRYLHGIEFDPNTFRLALLEGGQGKIGTLVDQILLFCFQFDPSRSRYTLYAWNIMRIGAVFMVVLLLIILVPAWFRDKKQSHPA